MNAIELSSVSNVGANSDNKDNNDVICYDFIDTVPLEFLESILNANPTKQIINYLSTHPNLSDHALKTIQSFYQDKKRMIQFNQVYAFKSHPIQYKHHIDKYNSYKHAFTNNRNYIQYLDEFFVDETCVTFLVRIYINNIWTIQSIEIMVEN